MTPIIISLLMGLSQILCYEDKTSETLNDKCINYSETNTELILTIKHLKNHTL